MLEPIRALFASSFSKNGINEAATETSCFGETSIYSIVSGFDNKKFKFCLHETNSSTILLFLSILVFACAIVNFVSSIADKYSTLSCTTPSFTLLYGLSIKPYLFIFA